MTQAATHDFGATYLHGIVTAVDAQKHVVRVIFPALENMQSDWLPMLTLAAGGNQFYCLPDIGALAVCLMDARGESGAVLGTIYNSSDPTPANSQEMHVLQYSNGTRIEHNRATGDMLIKTNGTVTIDADCVIEKTLTVNGLLTYTAGMNGSGGSGAAATIDGSLETTGDVTAGGISLQRHKHGGDSGGTTTSPQ